MFKRIVSAGLVFGMAIVAPPAHAQTSCGERAAITAKLQENFREQHRASGLENSARIVEFWTSEETGTWTVLITHPNGTSCIAASGKAFVEYPKLTGMTGVSS